MISVVSLFVTHGMSLMAIRVQKPHASLAMWNRGKLWICSETRICCAWHG